MARTFIDFGKAANNALFPPKKGHGAPADVDLGEVHLYSGTTLPEGFRPFKTIKEARGPGMNRTPLLPQKPQP